MTLLRILFFPTPCTKHFSRHISLQSSHLSAFRHEAFKLTSQRRRTWVKMRDTPILCRRLVSRPPRAHHVRHPQAQFMSLSPALRLHRHLLRMPLCLLEPHPRNSSSVHLSRIRCPWWNTPLHPQVRQAGLMLGRQAQTVTVMNSSLGVTQRVGRVRATPVGHKEQVPPDGCYSV
jgi:hypothetical protein